MALSASRLAAAIKTTLTAEGFTFGAGAMNTKFVDAVASAIVTEIETNAVVSGPVNVASVSGVTAGTGISGPGTGTLVNGVIS